MQRKVTETTAMLRNFNLADPIESLHSLQTTNASNCFKPYPINYSWQRLSYHYQLAWWIIGSGSCSGLDITNFYGIGRLVTDRKPTIYGL